MKAGVFLGKNNLQIMEIPKPIVKSDEVLIKVKVCGVCGTDFQIYSGNKGCFDALPGTVLGHEIAGVVEAVGEDVYEVKVGDRVCVDPYKLCNSCYYCKNGMGHFCENAKTVGTGVNGGFAEYCAVPQSQVFVIGDNVTFEQAAMTEPLACCVHGIDQCEISCGDTVAVIGGGMIGMIMLQLAKLSGAGKLILIEPVAEKREIAKGLGADLCIDPIKENVQEVLKQNGIKRIACVIECAGKTFTMKQAIDIAGKKSVVMLFSVCGPDEEVPIKPYEIFKKEIVLKSSFINPYCQQRALELLNGGKIDVTSVVYDKVPLEKLPEVFENNELRAKGKLLICPEE